jgi:hypothetical protein
MPESDPYYLPPLLGTPCSPLLPEPDDPLDEVLDPPLFLASSCFFLHSAIFFSRSDIPLLEVFLDEPPDGRLKLLDSPLGALPEEVLLLLPGR